MIFRLSGGLYYQPPFYRALRDSTGAVRPEVKAQKSTHIVLGNDYSFKLGGRPFTLVSEAYYKSITDVNPYTIENVRIRYRARNNAEAYAYGLDLRLNGEFVPGTESWVSFGYMKNGRKYRRSRLYCQTYRSAVKICGVISGLCAGDPCVEVLPKYGLQHRFTGRFAKLCRSLRLPNAFT